MKIELYWDNEDQTMLLCEFHAGWTWDDLFAILKTVKKLSEERQQMFGALIDLTRGMTLPGGSIFNPESLQNFQKVLQLGGDGKGPVAIIGAGSMARMVVDTIRRMNAKVVEDVVFASTLDEGRKLLYPRLGQAGV